MSFAKRLILPLGFLALMTFNACTPDDEAPFEEETKNPAAFTYSAKINGSSWAGKQNLSLLVKNTTGTPSKEMRISANSSDGKLLTLTLEDASTGVTGDGIAVKTYVLKLTGTSDASFVYVDTQTSKTYVGAYGSVTISKSNAVDKKLSGVFECTLYQSSGDSLKVTNGVITDLPYDITEQ